MAGREQLARHPQQVLVAPGAERLLGAEMDIFHFPGPHVDERVFQRGEDLSGAEGEGQRVVGIALIENPPVVQGADVINGDRVATFCTTHVYSRVMT